MAKELVPYVAIENKIFLIRGQKVMIDRDLADLYGVKTMVLNQAVKRNLMRFPPDFMFQLTKGEYYKLRSHFATANLISQNVISRWGGTRKAPFVFTEHGILMLSSVLRSKKAVLVNIQIMRTFTKLRRLLATHADLRRKIAELEKKYDGQFKVVFEAINELMEMPDKIVKNVGFLK
jgi:hypothetical protein